MEVFPSSADVFRLRSGVCLGIRLQHIFTRIITELSIGKQHFGVNGRYVDVFKASQRWLDMSVGVRVGSCVHICKI